MSYLNYILYLGESTLILGDIERIYILNKNLLFTKFLEYINKGADK